MKKSSLVLGLVLGGKVIVGGAVVALAFGEDAPPIATNLYTVPDGGDALVEWLLVQSKEIAHRIEPRNPVPKAMPRKLAELLVAETRDPSLAPPQVALELIRDSIYAFAEGSYSMDPGLVGDCKDEEGHQLPPGTPACTPKLIEAQKKCCDPKRAQHWCTMQVAPKPATMEECIHRGAETMKKANADCPQWPGAEYATGSCQQSNVAAWRERLAQKLLMQLPPP